MAVRLDTEGEGYTATSALPTAPCTILCWAKIVNDRDNYSSVWCVDSGVTAYIILGTDFSGTVARGSFSDIDIGFNAWTPNTWYKTALTVSGTTVTVYQAPAGATLASTSGTSGALPSAPTSLRLGSSMTTGEWFDGSIANFKHYSAVLTSTEIEAELGSWTSVRTANLVRHYKLQIPETTDYSGNGNTVTGGVGASTDTDDPPISTPPPIPADLTFVGSTTWAAGTTAAAPTYPASLLEGDVVYAIVETRAGTAVTPPAPTTPANWTLIADHLSSVANSATVGAGPTRIFTYKRVVPSGGLSGTQSFTVTGGSATLATMKAWRATGPNVQYTETETSYTVAAASTTISGSPLAGLSLDAKSVVNIVVGVPDDTTTTITVSGISATGATFGALTRSPDVAAAVTANGNDMSANSYHTAVTAGASTDPPAITGSMNAAETAVVSLLRIRATISAPLRPSPVVANQTALVRASTW